MLFLVNCTFANMNRSKDSKPNGLKVLVGMSGGVDSSVTALLLQKQGYEVVGAFMKNWSDGEEGIECGWRAERRDAMRVCAQLGIDLLTFDFEEEYRARVYEYMLREYEAGRTPNPDVLCNKYMKFGFLMREAEALGCDFVATGHYARISRDEQGVAHLLAGVDQSKDQSYFLCQLNQGQLRKTLFPVGELHKHEVREIAREHGLVVADKKDSQGICFVGKVELHDFLKERLPEREGAIVTVDGAVIGTHRGHMYYTIGQRHGLGIGGGVPYFVVERRAETNELVVAKADDERPLMKRVVRATELVETIEGGLNKRVGKELLGRIRYRQPLEPCVIEEMDHGVMTVRFLKDQRAVAPGQFLALYDGDELVGSGVIDSSE